MEENKYYTPEIEEFCVGFEYETTYLKSVWTKEVLYKMDSDWFFASYINDAVETEFRVKLLDRQDIESLGFTDKPIAVDQKFSYYKLLENDKVCQITTYWDMNKSKRDNLIRIYVGYLNKYPYTEIFRGDIKNKSELQKLLKQLEV